MPVNETPKYRLKVTAGPSYDPFTHQLVPVNDDQTLRIENEHAITSLCVRIQDYTGKGKKKKNPPQYTNRRFKAPHREEMFEKKKKKKINDSNLLK